MKKKKILAGLKKLQKGLNDDEMFKHWLKKLLQKEEHHRNRSSVVALLNAALTELDGVADVEEPLTRADIPDGYVFAEEAPHRFHYYVEHGKTVGDMIADGSLITAEEAMTRYKAEHPTVSMFKKGHDVVNVPVEKRIYMEAAGWRVQTNPAS